VCVVDAAVDDGDLDSRAAIRHAARQRMPRRGHVHQATPHTIARRAHEHGVQQGLRRSADPYLVARQLAAQLPLCPLDARTTSRLPCQRWIPRDQCVFSQAVWSEGGDGEERKGQKEPYHGLLDAT